jgi:ribosomal protein S18 acetylase RimI-like enzyme
MADAELRVRAGEARDLEAIAGFQVEMAAETEGKPLALEVVTRGVRAALADPAKGRYLVAERAGRVVASLMLTREWSDWRDGWFWWIQSVYTVPDERGHGVYRALYARVLEEARAEPDVRGVRLYVEVENQLAQQVYERLGMQRTSYRLYEVELAR